MTEQEYRALPRNVREYFSAIRDEEFSSHPEVVSLQQRQADAEEQHRKFCVATSLLRKRKAKLEFRRDELMASKRLAIETRQDRLVAYLCEDKPLDAKADQDAAIEIERFQAIAEAIPAAIQKLDRMLVESNRQLQHLAREIASAQEALRGTLDNLKLAEAYNRLG